MNLLSGKMVQYNGFPNRLLELVRIFTGRLMMTRWRRLCIGSVGAGMIERVIHGNRSHIYRDMSAWWKCSRNHVKKMLRDWMLTVGVRQNQKKHMLSKTLPNILSCAWKVLPHQCGLWACFRWWVGIPACAWNEPNRARLAILQFGMQHAQCQDVDLWPNIRTLPIWRITMSQLELITKNLQIDWHQCSISTGKRGWDLQQMGGLLCLTHLSLLLSQQTRSPAVTSSLSSGLFERIDLCPCPRRTTNSTTS